MGSSRERRSVTSHQSVASKGQSQVNHKQFNDLNLNVDTRSARSSLRSRLSGKPNPNRDRRRSGFSERLMNLSHLRRNSNISQISGMTSLHQEREPTKVTHILQKRTPYVKYDPWKNVEEGPIQLLLRNEVAKGRLRDQDFEIRQEQARKLRAMRHWGYLRRVARAIGRNQLDMKLREKARLESEMEQRRMALAAEEVMMEKARLEAEEKDKKEKEGEEDTGKEDPEEAESFDFDGIDLSSSDNRNISLPVQLEEASQRSSSEIDPRLALSLNDLPGAHDVTRTGCNLVKDPFSEHVMPLFSTSSLRQHSHNTGAVFPETRLLDMSTDESYIERGAEPVLHAQNDSLEALDDSSPAPPPYPPPVYDEIILSNRRSIFAAPPWNPDVEGDLERVYREVMERPLAYSGMEKAVDVPDNFEQRSLNLDYSTKELKEQYPVPTHVELPPKKYAFSSPSVQTMEKIKGEYFDPLHNDSLENTNSKISDESIFEEVEEVEKNQSADQSKGFDWIKEYQRRVEEIQKQKKELEELEHKALRFKEDDKDQKSASIEKSYIRGFLHGYSIMPENYTGKIVINVHYGASPFIPKEARIKNGKEQLYVGITHIFDFTRFERLNKKRPMVAFKIRPFDKSFPLPKGAEKYREVVLNRKSGEVSGENCYCTFEIPQKAVMKRSLFIRVKAFQRNIPQNFLGEVKINMADYESAQDIRIVDKMAYLYGKFVKVGTVEVEMFYKVQQGCLQISILKANLLPTVKSTGDTYMKIYHTYMGRMVEKVRTGVVLESFTPEYNETFTFKLPRGMVEESCLSFKLFSKPAVAVSSDSVTGEVKLAQRTNCNDWKNFFVGALMCKHPCPTKATLPLMRYIYS